MADFRFAQAAAHAAARGCRRACRPLPCLPARVVGRRGCHVGHAWATGRVRASGRTGVSRGAGAGPQAVGTLAADRARAGRGVGGSRGCLETTRPRNGAARGTAPLVGRACPGAAHRESARDPFQSALRPRDREGAAGAPSRSAAKPASVRCACEESRERSPDFAEPRCLRSSTMCTDVSCHHTLLVRNISSPLRQFIFSTRIE